MQESSSYPIRFAVQYPESLSRLLNFPLGIGTTIKLILVIPSLVVWYVFWIVAAVLVTVASFAILFSGRFPRGMHDFVAGALRLQGKMQAYLLSLSDVYPGFSGAVQLDDAARLDVEYPESSSRLLNFPILGFYIRTILVIPQIVIMMLTGLVAYVLIFIAQFAILFGGSFPEGMFKFVAGTLQLSMRTTAYLFSLTDRYPPFSVSADA